SLLTLVSPLQSADGRSELPLAGALVQQSYFLRGEPLKDWVIGLLKTLGGDERTLMRQVGKRQALLVALESYLMANRGTGAFEDFLARVRTLAESTLAFALATEEQKGALLQLFEL